MMQMTPWKPFARTEAGHVAPQYACLAGECEVLVEDDRTTSQNHIHWARPQRVFQAVSSRHIGSREAYAQVPPLQYAHTVRLRTTY